MHESTQICIKHCQNGRIINKTHVDYLNAGMMCKLYVTFIFGEWGSGSITSVGEERANLSAVVCL